MADFNSIPVRINGQRFDASWWNSIRDALISSDATPAFANYADDAEYEAAKGSAGSEGDYYYNTTTDFLKFHNGTDWVTVADAETAQTFTNKVIDGSSNTITNLTHGDQVDNPTSNVHGVTTDITGIGDVQSLTNKTIDADSNTISNLEHGAEVDNPAIAHGTASAIVGVDDTQTLTNKTIGDDLTITGDLTVVGDYYGGDVIEVTDPAITVNKDGSQSSADDVAGIEVDMSDADNAKITYDSSLASKWKVGDINSESEIITATDTQDASNKAIIDPSRLDVKKDTYANLETYAATATDGQLCFATDSLATYIVHSGALNEVGGGGSGQGGINYITNYNAEEGLTDWSVVGTIPFSQETTSPLFGTASFKISSAGANYIGDYVKVATQTIDPAMKYNVLSGSMWVRNEDLNSDDMGLKVWDVTNSAYVSMFLGETIGASSAGDFTHKFLFQATDSLNYEIHLEVLSTATITDPFDFLWDEINLGPNAPYVTGGVITEWKSYTPAFSGFGTPTNVSMNYKRVGSDLYIQGEFTSDTTTATLAGIGLPSGLVIGSTLASESVVGTFTGDFSTPKEANLLGNAGDSFLNVSSFQASVDHLTPVNANTLTGSGQAVRVEAGPIQIAGWQSNVVMSDTVLNRHIAVKASGNASDAITADVSNIPFNGTVSQDTTNAWTGSQFIAPEAGDYAFSGSARQTAANGANLYLSKTGSSSETKYVFTNQANSNTKQFSGKFTLDKGDVVVLRSDLSITLSNNNILHYIEIEKTNVGSQTIATSEKVYVFADTSTTQSIPNGAYTTKTYADNEVDTHSAWDGSTFTVPRDGYYTISGTVAWSDSTQTLAEIGVTVNSSKYYGFEAKAVNVTSSAFAQVGGSITLSLEKGDTFQYRVFQRNSGLTSLSTYGDRQYNHMSIISN